ncbi:hypothetical protein CFOL_v3_17856 [Cephalotus follicularis]|uniref:RING-type domain-containing protein n=1 Tax=Cephalotus follicularis TaxID=3775 RepID=A0A1Q3C2E0_CEPFO|nr:hypothetical protein CFOL_v3_17856 [Cephalotus follicularis]
MVSDSIINSSVPSALNSKDFGKKKRANRSAKLKQCKLDARREQWLSQGAGKTKGCEENKDNVRREFPKHSRKTSNEREPSFLEMRGRVEGIGESIHHHESDMELSPANSPTSILLGSTESGTNFSGSSSSSSSSGGCCSGCITEEEEDGDDGCLDDWEAIADALAADDLNQNQNQKQCTELPPQHGEPITQFDPMRDLSNLKPEHPRMVQRTAANTGAWRPDDVFRPQTLPNLSKLPSFPATDRKFSKRGVPWACNNAVNAPSSCPICCEDLDFTDTKFFPCLCGFRLCLFCHKRIIEDDGRCPGCRKPYEHEPLEVETSVHGGSLTFRLSRSCSMNTRS